MNKVDVLGIKFDTLKKSDLLSKLSIMLNENRQVFLVTPYSESIVKVQSDQNYQNILNSADFILPDGAGVLWAANYIHTERWLIPSLISVFLKPKSVRYPIPEKISGSEFIWDLARLAESRGESIFLLGGFGNTPKVVARRLKERFSKLQIAGTHTGSPDEPNLIEQINSLSPDYLLVAFGPETQEKWIYNHQKNLNARLLIGLGGTFDYVAGKRPSAPKIWRSTGLEWLWRLITQPWRAMRVLKGVFGLIYHCFKHKHAL